MTTVHLELISDFICPWCYLGKMRIERLQSLLKDEIELDIAIKPYVLYPHIPKGGLPKSDFAKKTKPGMGRSLRYEATVERIQFNYKNIERIPYSLEAHRLIWLIQDNKQQYEVAKKIFYAYFEKGQDIENFGLLSSIAKSKDVPVAIIKQFEEATNGLEEVKQAIQTNRAAFITVVPSLKIDRKIMLPGLQPIEVWENYIRRAARLQEK